jgi:uncharacterized HAD superfamily protein
MAGVIRRNLDRVPRDVDLVVGIPRSGMLAATIVALHLNARVCDLQSFALDIPLSHGRVRSPRQGPDRPQDAAHVLLVDDSIASGQSMKDAMTRIRATGFPGKVTKCAVYATAEGASEVDVAIEALPLPRAFEWNLLHRKLLERCCVDLDGILCVDPTDEENDDADNYLAFLAKATPMHSPSYKIGRIVTSRLEKYRAATEAWLGQHGIAYERLDMLDLPDAGTRRARRAHAAFKAKVYALDRSMVLFVESNDAQAREIARLSGKPAIAFGSQSFFQGDAGLATSLRSTGWRLARAARRLRQRMTW